MHNKLLLYDTFNARYLSFQEVSESFVSNEEFFKLTGNNSILLMGPRGCGKTTLLKMLTPAGLSFWKGKEAEQIKKELGFTAIYIPSDIQWKNQFDYLTDHLGGNTDFIKIVTEFLFASNIQIALCKSFNSVIGFGNFTDEEKVILEFEVCKALVKVWDFEEKTIPTFDDLELIILKRVRSINEITKKIIFNRDFGNIKKVLPDYIFANFFDLVKLGCKVFEQKLELKNDHKWSLCFDELEIVPKFLQIELIKYLRSVDQKFLFKLTTTPLFNIENTVLDSTQGNDFNSIKLWVYDDLGLNRWRSFCQKLLINRFEKKYKAKDFRSFFGEHNLDILIKEELDSLNSIDKRKLGYSGKLYPGVSKNSSMYFLYRRLAQIDESFKKFLESRGVNPQEPYSDDKTIQKSVFLKYKIDTVYRLIYRKRTRKTPPIHFGIPYIYDICDGNPRLVIGLIDEILQNSKFDITESIEIEKSIQSKIIFNASEKYLNLLKNHPDSTIIVSNSEFNLASNLLEKIGKFMHRKMVQEEFSKTSPSTFIIDENINSKFINLLETALYLGAIVYLDPIESLSNKGILGKRFRLSSFLTPKYKIPSRINSQVKLSAILKNTKDNDQQTFFE